MMCYEIFGLTTQAKRYDTILDTNSNGDAPDQPYTSTTPLFGLLDIKIHVSDLVSIPPMRNINKSKFNPSACVAQNYNIV